MIKLDDRDPVDVLVSKLDALKSTGQSRWISRCPAHDDRSPSLSIQELPNKQVLINCFAGCSALDVMQSVGLELRDLYLGESTKPDSKWRAHKYSGALDVEEMILAIADSDQTKRELSKEEIQRVKLAEQRVKKLRGLIHDGE